MAAAQGCTLGPIPTLGTTTTRYFQTPDGTGRAVHINTLGLSLRTVAGDAGFTLGRSIRTYYLPGPASQIIDCPGAQTCLQLASSSPDRLRLHPSDPFDWSSSMPLAVAANETGLAIHANRRIGATIGARASSAVHIRPSSDLVLLIRQTTTDPQTCSLFIQQKEPNP